MQLAKLLDVCQTLAPEHFAQQWDNVGLLLGDLSQQVQKALLCIDLTAAVLAEAEKKKVDLIVAYHPPIFSPLKKITMGPEPLAHNPTVHPGRLILQAAQKGIAIYSPHTALDDAPDGVNDWLACGLCKGGASPIEPLAGKESDQCKVVCFVPPDAANQVTQAMSNAGAGQLGAYDQCSFSSAGIGQFRGGPTTRPTIGKPGQLEQVQEHRLEMICPRSKLAKVIDAIVQTHPYEEPAYEAYALLTEPAHHGRILSLGHGRVVQLPRAATLEQIIARIKKHLDVPYLQVAVPMSSKPTRKGFLGIKVLSTAGTSDATQKLARPALSKKINTIGLCAGSGGSLLKAARDIDLFWTGEMRHHDVLAATSRGIAVVLAGHTQTERPYLKIYRKRLAKVAKSVQWVISSADAQPLAWA